MKVEAARALVYVKEAFAEQGGRPSVPARDVASLTTMERDGDLTIGIACGGKGRGCRQG